MKVSLLDERRMEIPGCVYDTGMKKAPVGYWAKEEHIFTNIPPGVRFVKFSDGGNDCKNWAGFYGAKMVGAFVGVLLSCKYLFYNFADATMAACSGTSGTSLVPFYFESSKYFCIV